MAETTGRKPLSETEYGRKGFGRGLQLMPHGKLGLKQVLEKALDKGVVIDAKIRAFLGETKLLSIRGHIMLTTFEKAATYGLILPDDVNLEAAGWRDLLEKDNCPQCYKLVKEEEIKISCPWCGFKLGGE